MSITSSAVLRMVFRFYVQYCVLWDYILCQRGKNMEFRVSKIFEEFMLNMSIYEKKLMEILTYNINTETNYHIFFVQIRFIFHPQVKTKNLLPFIRFSIFQQIFVSSPKRKRLLHFTNSCLFFRSWTCIAEH